jgi:hypothetical protein
MSIHNAAAGSGHFSCNVRSLVVFSCNFRSLVVTEEILSRQDLVAYLSRAPFSILSLLLTT